MAGNDRAIKEVRNWREFEDELAKLGEEIRNTIELECEAFDTDPATSKARRERAWHDYEFFCRTYFPHYVPTAFFSLFQQFIFKRLPEVIDGPTDGREVHQAPRGEAKSTYETQLGSLWCIVTGRKHMIGIIMNTEEQAAEMLESIKAELDTNPRLAMDFPEACGRGRVWQATTIVTSANGRLGRPGVAFLSVSSVGTDAPSSANMTHHDIRHGQATTRSSPRWSAAASSTPSRLPGLP